jgi:hypothetical protein
MISGECQILKTTPLFNIHTDNGSRKTYRKTIERALLRHADIIDPTGSKTFLARVSFLSADENHNESGDEFMFVEVFAQLGRQKETR